MSPPATDSASDIMEKQASSRDEEATMSQAIVDPKFAKRTIRKIDRRVLLILGALYAISLIDRTNISIARVAGMAKDLQLTVGERYSIISLCFFPPYILFELPSNVLMRKFGARNQLSAITILWGAVMLGMGFVTNWAQLAICRCLLGVLEAGLFPGSVFLISSWYTRFETHKKMAFFYLTSLVLNGFSNILGYGISQLGHAHGIAPWRWIFIIFGAATIGLGLIAYMVLVDFPDKATFLSTEEKAFVLDRLDKDRGDARADHVSLMSCLRHLKDVKLWLFAILYMCTTLPSYSFAYFLSIILAGGGFSTKLSLLLSAPPYLSAAIFAYGVAYASDRTRHRGGFIVFGCVVCTVGLFIVAYGGKIGVRLFGAFLAIAGCQSNVPALLTYSQNNVTGHSKRAASTAMIVGGGGIGGIIATTVYRQADYPKYIPGLYTTIGAQILICLIIGGLSLHFRRENRKVDEEGHIIEGTPGFKFAI